MKKNRKW